MPDMHVQYHSASGKRPILIASADEKDFETLHDILEDKFVILRASDYEDALQKIDKNLNTLGLVILDHELPDNAGPDLLKRIKNNPDTNRIPVIVISSDHQAEADSLSGGAAEFISMPLPPSVVLLTRIQHAIELCEIRDVIKWTERDKLSGLYNRDYFYRYCQQYDLHHPEIPMDALVIDVNHFHLLNERYGRITGDTIIKDMAALLLEVAIRLDGLACRRQADTFLMYCPHRPDYHDLLERILKLGNEKVNTSLKVRMGVYHDVDKSIDIEQRFVRAKLAADTVKDRFKGEIGVYDHSLHEAELRSVVLQEGFHEAIAKKQFEVYYQPKYDIRSGGPELSSSEALIRWNHPQYGLLMPDTFIPMFEKNGFIQELDKYTWDEVASRISRWKKRFGSTLPVSVNVSRVDVYDNELSDYLISLLAKYDISPTEFLLEITESAYTQDSDQIIENIKKMRDAGFRIEIDDFGSGYSSLNMLTTMPVDAVKLDIEFIRTAFQERKDTRMLEAAISIAETLNVPTVAEGVETEEQLNTLKAIGCDIVQGYYFSKPVPADQFEELLRVRLGK